jgi:hypothetical protein
MELRREWTLIQVDKIKMREKSSEQFYSISSSKLLFAMNVNFLKNLNMKTPKK